MISLLIFLGILTTLGNLLVLFIFVKSNKADRMKRDYMKASLAVADIVKGKGVLF